MPVEDIERSRDAGSGLQSIVGAKAGGVPQEKQSWADTAVMERICAALKLINRDM